MSLPGYSLQMPSFETLLNGDMVRGDLDEPLLPGSNAASNFRSKFRVFWLEDT